MGTIVAEVIDAGNRDSRGRRRIPVAQRADYVRAYRESGLNQAAFAKREGLRYSTFAHWVQKAAKGELVVSRREGAMQFAEVQMPPSAPATNSTCLEVRLSDGVVVRGDDVQKLAALVRALRS